MDTKTFFNRVQEPTIIICSHDLKVTLLTTLTNEKLFKPITFMHPREFIEHAYGKIEDQALFEASVFFDLKPSIVEAWLPYLYTIDVSKTYSSKRITKLQTLKKSLISKGYFKLGSLAFYTDKRVYVETHNNALLREALKRVTHEVLPIEQKNVPIIDYYEHAYQDDEIAHTMVKIRALIHEGVNPEAITLATDLTETMPLIKHYLNLFDIPFQSTQSSSLWSYPLTQQFFNALSTKTGDAYQAINDSLESLKTANFDETRLKITTSLINVLNQFVTYNEPIEALQTMIKHTLKKTSLNLGIYKNALNLVSLNAIPNTLNPYLFITGVCEGAFPKLTNKPSYLTEDEKALINYPNNQTMQVLTKTQFLSVLNNYQHITLSYAKQSSKKRYYESTFLNQLKTHFTVNKKQPLELTHQPYTKNYDQYNAKRAYERLLNYNESSDALTTLTPYFINTFNTYDHTFTGLSKPTTTRIFGDTLKLSYTKLNTYFQCKFKYLMDYGLKVDKIKNTLPLDLGTLTHDIVEHHLNTDTFDETVFEAAVKDITQKRHYTAREIHLLNLNFTQIKNALTIIKRQRNASKYTFNQAEQTITKPYPNALFNGKIDAVYMNEQTQDIFLIDYKTGNATLNIQHAYYGFNVQLLYYALLMKHEAPDKPLTGFYEQSLIYKPKVLPNNKTALEAIEEHLKLNGYTLNDEAVASTVDTLIDDDSFIKGMKTKKDGSFHKSAKIYDEDELNLWVAHLDTLIHESIQSILSGDFAIDPKQTSSIDISCKYCTYKDICFKDEHDTTTITPMDQEALTKAIKKARDDA